MEQNIVLELYDHYADMVYRIALSYLRSTQDAEDTVQTIFLKLMESDIKIITGKERAFLTKVTINHCKNLLSAARRHETIPLDEVEGILFSQPEEREVFRAVMELPKNIDWLSSYIILRDTRSEKLLSFYTLVFQQYPCVCTELKTS